MDTALNFAIALFIGVLVGIEREIKKGLEQKSAIGGIRTFALFALAGAASAWMAGALGSPWIFAVALAATGAGIVAGYVFHAVARPDALGMTTEVAALLVFLLGGACALGYTEQAVIVGIATSAILAYKQPLHALVHKIGMDDLLAALKLLIATFIVLPFLPDRTIDPWDIFNPYKTWLLVILISGLSLVGYVAIRWLGARTGTLLTGLAGGLASSTAVTLAFARRSRDEAAARIDAAMGSGLMLAWLVMFFRVLIEVAVVNRAMLRDVLAPIGAMGVASAAVALALYRRQDAAQAHVPELAVRNPFSLTSAIQFALFFTAVMAVVKLVQTHLPGQGLVVVAGLAGLTDVDAITLSMASYAAGGGDQATATTAIVVASLANTLAKCGMVVALGSPGLRRAVATGTAVILATGAAAILAR